MAAQLPALEQAEFERRLGPWLTDVPLVAARLFAHYCELRQWASRLSLIGPGTVASVVERHYGESLEAAPLLPSSGQLVDLGSGAGFPGLVLAAVAPQLSTTLVESRTRKAAFLSAAGRAMDLPVRVLQERVTLPLSPNLPEPIDCLTARAVRLEPRVWQHLVARLSDHGIVLLWAGRDTPELAGLAVDRELSVEFSEHRRILRYRRT